jgi:hypothetical protein
MNLILIKRKSKMIFSSSFRYLGEKEIKINQVFQDGGLPHATYLFKHALVQDGDRLEPAGDWCASLHRGRADRKGQGLMGK